MDVAWRLVVGFMLEGADMKRSQVAWDDHSGLLVIFRPDYLPRERLRTWVRLAKSAGSQGAQRRLQKAIADGDIITVRQLLRTAIHVALDKMHIVAGSSEGFDTRLWWRSQVHRIADGCMAYRGDSKTPGTIFHIWVDASYRSHARNTRALFPQMEHESDLMNLFFLPSDTPSRPSRSTMCSPSSAGLGQASALATPALYNSSEPFELCELCGIVYPLPLMMELEACGHFSCLSCLGQSVQHRAANPLACPTNFMCPHEGCGLFLSRQEVAQLVPNESFASLEWNELKLLLRNGALQCPACGFLFERVNADDLEGDPLRDKITCVACHDTFCAVCFTAPFHDGRPCRHGGDDGSAAPKCRYCGSPAQSNDPPVCDAPLCRSRGQQACLVPKPCGHHCYGSCGELSCVSCLEEGCPDAHPQQSADDFCIICYTDGLADAPCLQLECGHVFHRACIEKKIEQRWPCARINFKFLQCPLCEKEMSHHLLAKLMAPVNKLRESLEKRYMDRLKMEGLDESPALTDTSSPYFGQPLGFAADQFNYYQCSKCKRPYFGGLRRCQDVERDEPDKSDLICGGCCAGSAQCDRHGSHYLEWKCKYCCNTAVWFCWGTTHFCELCHSPPRKTVREECEGEELCPLKAMHPANGVEFALGCAMCRSRQKRVTSEAQ